MTPTELVAYKLEEARDAIRYADRHQSDAIEELGDDLDTLAEVIAQVQDVIRDARALEGLLTMAAGNVAKRRDWAERQGNLVDGRQFRLHRTTERKRWDHEEWKRMARREVVKAVAPHADDVAVDAATGEARPLGQVLQEAMAKLQEFHGSTDPKVTTLKAYELDPADYCTQTPGVWKLDAIAPTENHDQNED